MAFHPSRRGHELSSPPGHSCLHLLARVPFGVFCGCDVREDAEHCISYLVGHVGLKLVPDVTFALLIWEWKQERIFNSFTIQIIANSVKSKRLISNEMKRYTVYSASWSLLATLTSESKIFSDERESWINSLYLKSQNKSQNKLWPFARYFHQVICLMRYMLANNTISYFKRPSKCWLWSTLQLSQWICFQFPSKIFL